MFLNFFLTVQGWSIHSSEETLLCDSMCSISLACVSLSEKAGCNVSTLKDSLLERRCFKALVIYVRLSYCPSGLGCDVPPEVAGKSEGPDKLPVDV